MFVLRTFLFAARAPSTYNVQHCPVLLFLSLISFQSLRMLAEINSNDVMNALATKASKQGAMKAIETRP